MLKYVINIKFTCWNFFHLFTRSAKSYVNKVIFLIFLMFLLFQKNVLVSTVPLNVLELLINCWDILQAWTTKPFWIIFFILSTIFIWLIILLVLCNNVTKCNHHGTCGDDGNCICDNGYYGPNCSSKLKFFILGCTQLQAALKAHIVLVLTLI